MTKLTFLENSAVTVARILIGWRLYCVQSDGSVVGGIITETEAYNQNDAASHSYRGETPRTKVMFGPAGHVYVYFTYGMHYCMNIVTGPEERGEAVLIRSLQLDKGIAIARERRQRPDSELTDGPAKICQALGVGRGDNGKSVNGERFKLEPPLREYSIVATERIGIREAKERLWRFIIQ
jgi:DNA-3-methyladenine glycosylase